MIAWTLSRRGRVWRVRFPRRRAAVLLLLLLALLGCRVATAGAVDAARVAETVRWGPGQLEAHFEKHGAGYRGQSEYDAAARETIRRGTQFTYLDRESGQRRRGFYERSGNEFTSVTLDATRIATHFRPDGGERYVRALAESTYR